jgi:hypothetical protein
MDPAASVAAKATTDGNKRVDIDATSAVWQENKAVGIPALLQFSGLVNLS